ncbi:MAG: hypothetical protein ACYDCJ_09135 [Gammaproteobacteria bacterium]
MSTHPFLAGLQSNPDFLLQNFDLANRRALIVRVSEGLYREASFLDDRLFNPQMEGFWLPLESVLQETSRLTAAAPHYIFHVGHCGSTLISRLLAELPGCLPLREPMALLTLAVARRELGRPGSWVSPAQWDQLLQTATRALARTYRDADRAIIKATSTAGNLLEVIGPQADSDSRLLMMYIGLESMLALMLRTPGLRDSIHAYSPVWLTDFCRLTGRNDINLAGLGDAQQIAVKWLTLLLLFHRTKLAAPERVRLLNFDDFLQRPAEEFADIAALFRLQCDQDKARSLCSGPLMRSYSKIPAQNFDPAQRERELQTARQQFRIEIHAGLEWAETLCRETPELEPVGPYLHNSIQTA